VAIKQLENERISMTDETVRKNIEDANRRDNARLAKAQREEVARREGNAPRDETFRPERTSDIYSIAQNNKATATNHTPLTEADNASPRWDSVEAVLATQAKCKEIAELTPEQFTALRRRMERNV
jgi:hypothetical protein